MGAGLKGASYKSYWRVEDENGAQVEGLGQSYRTKKKLRDFSVEIGNINVAPLATGSYTFVYGIADSAQDLQASRRKKFYIYNPSQTPGGSPAEVAEKMLASAGVAELDDEFMRMQHIVPRDEQRMYQSLANAEAKSKFILSLWEAHKPEEYINGIMFRRVYLARAREAEAMFTTVLRPGWKSDQGRVFILYGVPSNIEREPSNPTLKPYEIWRYDEIQGGVIFVFADRTGFKNYELIHSSHRNELQNPDWQRLITFESGPQ
jgi:GWxTD domain-containing protein